MSAINVDQRKNLLANLKKARGQLATPAARKKIGERTKMGEGNVNLQAMVVSRRETGPTASGKKGPVRMNVIITSCHTSEDDVKEASFAIKNGDEHTVRAFEKIHLSSFTVPENLPFGTLVRLCGMGGIALQGKGTYLNCKKVTVLSTDSFSTIEKMPASFFRLPSAAAVADPEFRDTNIVLRFRGNDAALLDHAEGAHVMVQTSDEDESSVFYHEDQETGKREIAFKGGLSYIQWGADEADPKPIYLDLRLFRSHLGALGICDTEAWTAIASRLLPRLVGYLPAYIDVNRTVELDINMEGANDDFNGGLNVKGLFGLTQWDLDTILPKVGFEVPLDFVKEFLDATPVDDHPLNDDRAADWINLSEAREGALDSLPSGSTFYFLANFSMDDEDEAEFRGFSASEQLDCLRKVPGAKLRVKWRGRTTFFARKGAPAVGSKRPRA